MSLLPAVRAEWRRSDRLLYVLTFALASGVAFAALELWAARLTVPLTYFGDALPTGSHFKTVIENGWYEYNAALGAPYGQTYNDFPTADNLHFIVAKVLALFTQDWAVAMNVYFILGFPLAAIAALWLLRRIGVSRAISVALAVVYAIAPYHFLRGESHLWLSSYYVVPFALGLVVSAIRGEALWGFRSSGPRLLRWATPRSLVTILIVALTGTAQSYYAVFFLILLAFAGLARLVASGEWKRFWGAAITGVLTAVVMVINMAPDVLYSVFEGANPGGFARGHAEAEIYALKLTQLLLPWGGHRIGFLASIRHEYDSKYPLASEGPALGAIAALGLVALMLILALTAAGWARRRAALAERPEFSLLNQLAALTFVALLFSMMGGLSSIISFVTASLRGWNRMSIVIAMLCLLAVGILLDLAIARLQRRIPGSVGKKAVAVVAAAAVLGIGYVDQTPAHYGSSYASNAAAFDADQKWVQSLEDSLPEGSMILQLPYQPFPESAGVTGVLESDGLIPYLHSDHLRWSGGGIKGRPRADYPGMLEHLPPDQIATLAAAAGFAGIYVDLNGLPEQDRTDLTTGLTAAVGSPRTSESSRYQFYDLAALRTELEAAHGASELEAIAELVTNPVTVTTSPSFGATISAEGARVFIPAIAAPELVLTNDRESEADVTLTLELRTDDTSIRAVTITLPDGTMRTVEMVDGVANASLPLTVAVGTSPVTLGVVGGASASALSLTLSSYDCIEGAVEDFLRD